LEEVAMASDTFGSAAKTGFDLLWSRFNKTTFDGNFWFAGNTFHTCLDYLINSGVGDTDGNVVTAGHQLYLDLYKASDWWRDDYAWWGDAFVVAIGNRSALKLTDPQYNAVFDAMSAAAAYCWQRMNNVWRDEPYGGPRDHAAGSANIRGGVFNQPYKDCEDQVAKIMQGRNSVTNEGYWLLSLGMQRLFPSPAYEQAAAAMGNWVQQWFARTPVCGKPTGLAGLLDDECHVLERPMGQISIPSWYWSGDQGLMSRALIEAGVQKDRALQIVNAAIKTMSDDQCVLHENLAFTNAGLSGYLGDYATGKGIFMRSLRAVNTGKTFDKYIVNNARAVWCNRHQDDNYPNQFTFNWDRKKGYEPIDLTSKGNPLDLAITQAAGLDALNAALLVVSPDTPVSCETPLSCQ
jgi:hypothetical protein